MVKRCSWGLCKSDSRYPERVEDVRFIRFPRPGKDLEKCKRWIKACGRPHDQLSVKTVEKNYMLFVCTKHFVDKNGPTHEFPDPLPAESCSKKETFKYTCTRKRLRSESPELTADLCKTETPKLKSTKKHPTYELPNPLTADPCSKGDTSKYTRKRPTNEIPDPLTVDPCSKGDNSKSTRKSPTNELPDPLPAVQCEKANEKTPKSAEKPPAKKSRLEHDRPRPLSIHNARPVLMNISEHQQFVIEQLFQQLKWNYQVQVLTPAEFQMLNIFRQDPTRSSKNKSATTGIIDGNSTGVSTVKMGHQTAGSEIMNDDSTVVSTVQVGDKDEKFVIEVVKDPEYVERKPVIDVKETVETFPDTDNVKETANSFPNNANMKETIQTFPNTDNVKETANSFPNNANMKNSANFFPNNTNLKETIQTFPNNTNLKETGSASPNKIYSVNPFQNNIQIVNPFPNNIRIVNPFSNNIQVVNAGYQFILPKPPLVPRQPLLVTSEPRPGVAMQRINSEPVLTQNTGKVCNEGHNTVNIAENITSQKPLTETTIVKTEMPDHCAQTNGNNLKLLMNHCETFLKSEFPESSKTDHVIKPTSEMLDGSNKSSNTSDLIHVVIEKGGTNEKPHSETVKYAVVKNGVLDDCSKTESDDQEVLVSDQKVVDMDSEETDSCSETENSMNDFEVRRKKNKVCHKKNKVLVDTDQTDYVQQVLDSKALTSINKSSDIDGSYMESGSEFETSMHENPPTMTFDHLKTKNQSHKKTAGHSYESSNTYNANTENETLAHSSESFNTHDSIVKIETDSYDIPTLTNENISEAENSSEMFPIVKVEVEDEGYDQAF